MFADDAAKDPGRGGGVLSHGRLVREEWHSGYDGANSRRSAFSGPVVEGRFGLSLSFGIFTGQKIR